MIPAETKRKQEQSCCGTFGTDQFSLRNECVNRKGDTTLVFVTVIAEADFCVWKSRLEESCP